MNTPGQSLASGALSEAASSSSEIVLDAVRELHDKEQVVTREALREVTGLKLSIIDDRIATLVEEGWVDRKSRGVFVPVDRHPPARPISKTVLPDGTVKIEIGDELLTLTPREDRILAMLQSGALTQTSIIEIGQQTTSIAGDIRRCLKEMEYDMNSLLSQEGLLKNVKKTLKRIETQGDLFHGKPDGPGPAVTGKSVKK
jgi:hypothetical protein